MSTTTYKYSTGGLLAYVILIALVSLPPLIGYCFKTTEPVLTVHAAAAQ